MKYSTSAAILFGLLAAQPSFAQENEVTGIYTSNSLGGDFSMLLFSRGLGHVGPAVHGDTKKSNLHFKVGVSKSRHDSTYDSVSGRGTDDGLRFMLAYGAQLSEHTTATLTGGVSHHRIKVRPVTASSPSDTNEWGAFVSADIYVYLGDKGSVFGLAEYDGAGSTFAMGSYIKTFGNFDIGPSLSYTSNRNYQHTTLGVSGTYRFDKNLELTLGAGKIWSRTDFYAKGNGNYLDLIFRIKF